MRQEHQILKLQLSKRKKLRLQKQRPTWARRLLFPPARYFVIALFLIKMFFEIFISRSFTCQWKLIGDALIPGWRGGGLFTNLQQRRRRGCWRWFQWISLNHCGFNLFVRKRNLEKAKLKENVPVHGCNAAIQVKHRVHLINQPDMLTPKSWQQPCFDGTKWGWNFTLALFASSCHGCVVYCRHHIRQLDMVSIKYAQAVYLCCGSIGVVNLPSSCLYLT